MTKGVDFPPRHSHFLPTVIPDFDRESIPLVPLVKPEDDEGGAIFNQSQRVTEDGKNWILDEYSRMT